MALVLCTGTIPEIMQARQESLERAGHKVVTVTGEKELSEACKKHNFDVVILGQTLVPEMKQHVVDLVRKHCSNIKILELYSTSEKRSVEDADDWIEVQNQVPATLADHIHNLTEAD